VELSVYVTVTRYSVAVTEADQNLVAPFESFYRSTRPRVYRAVALTVANSDLALDATDEAMARASARWQEVGAYENPSGWVYRVAVNWARTRLRRLSRERVSLDFEPRYEQTLPDPELIDAVMALSWNYRTVIVARFFLDWSVTETARALQIPEGTVKTRTHRALDRLRLVMEEDR
jgi:RNA polymerase sigma factor (sigma-70 family)